MKRFSDWKNSVLTISGDPNKHRKTIAKAAMLGLVALVAARTMMLPLSLAPEQTSTEHSGSRAHLLNRMDPIGQKLNALYGDDNKVIVYHNDAHLKNVISNARVYDKSGPGAATSIGSFRETISEAIAIFSSDATLRDQFARADIFDHMHADGGVVYRDAPDKGGTPERPTMVYALTKDKDSFNNISERARIYPYHTSRAAQDAFTFFHEMTHAVDNRDGRATRRHKTLQSESIADTGMALIALRETKNLDDYNYNLRPLRYSLNFDVEHMTVDLASQALSRVTYEDVAGKSDKELMIMAKNLVTEVGKQWAAETLAFEMDDKLEKRIPLDSFSFYNNVYRAHDNALRVGMDSKEFKERIRRLDLILTRMGHIKAEKSGLEVVRDFSREAMRNSLNNLLYNGAFNEQRESFQKGVYTHVRIYKDTEVALAVANASTISGNLDPVLFAQEMGFRLDRDAFARRESNERALSAHLKDVLSIEPVPALNISNVEVNTSKDVVSRYAAKTVRKIATNLNGPLP
ncbi:hypothetical protein ACI2KR_08595 [Pseudomonas luteola]